MKCDIKSLWAPTEYCVLIKVLMSKLRNPNRDGYLDFEEFKEMIMRARARKELGTQEDSDLDTQEMELLQLEQQMKGTKTLLYKVTEEDVAARGYIEEAGEEIEEDIVEQFSGKVVEPLLEDNIPEDLEFVYEESPKVHFQSNIY